MSDTTTPPPGTPAATAHSRGSDITRQVVVISATTFMLIAAVVGVGLLGGTPVQELQDGALAADATYLAPATEAFSIWTAIYVLMVAYTVWQALPGQRQNPRQRLLGYPIAVTAVLNGMWLVTAQFATLPLTVAAIALLLIALGWTFHLAVQMPATRWSSSILIDITVGLHLGWVALATVANTTALLTVTVPESWESAAAAWGIAVIAVVTLVGVGIAVFSRGRIAPGVAMAWGLTWIGVARAYREPESLPIAIAAWIAAAVILLVPIAVTIARTVRTPARGVRSAR